MRALVTKKEIMNEILSFFSSLYGTKTSSFICDGPIGKPLVYMFLTLLRPPLVKKEIREVVFEMGCLKSPRPDGMIEEFYKKS